MGIPSVYNKHVGWSSFAVVKRFWVLWANIYECIWCYNYCHGNAVMVIKHEDADKGFWTFWNNMWPIMYIHCYTTQHHYYNFSIR
jgi:hypothetical protein